MSKAERIAMRRVELAKAAITKGKKVVISSIELDPAHVSRALEKHFGKPSKKK